MAMLGIGKKLQDARKKQSLSLRELAAKTDVSASLLSQVENEKVNPSVRTLHSLADALSLPIDYFFPTRQKPEESSASKTGKTTPQPTISELPTQTLPQNGANGHAVQDVVASETMPNSPILRAVDRPTIELEGNVSWARLTPNKENGLEYMEISYQPGAASGERMSHHSGREFLLVTAGELTLDLGFEQYVLYPGDSAIFDSTTPHRLSNQGDGPMFALSIVSNQTFVG